MRRFEELVHEGRALNVAETPLHRDAELWRLATGSELVALLALIEDVKDGLQEEAAKYDRLEGERTMDAGGVQALTQLEGRLREIYERPPREEEKA